MFGLNSFTEVPSLPEDDQGRFDYKVARAMRDAFSFEATRLLDLAGTRASYVSTAKEDFAGFFSEVFQTNAATAAADAAALAQALETVAGYVRTMIQAGHEEDARREENNAWVKRHNDRNIGEKIGDVFDGGEERPNAERGPAPIFDSTSARVGTRDTQPGKGGSAGGTSSARPVNLRTFATNSRALNDALASVPGILEGHLADFADRCGWGRIEADGVITAYRAYLAANENDARWAQTLADDFTKAGGEGNVSTLSDAALAAALAPPCRLC